WRLAYCASSAPDTSPPSSTSVTRARRSGPVEASTSSADAASAHSTTSSPSPFRRSARLSRWNGSSSTTRATKFDIIASGIENKSPEFAMVHRHLWSLLNVGPARSTNDHQIHLAAADLSKQFLAGRREDTAGT